MKIKELGLSQVNPAPYNPRKDLKPKDKEYKKLERSISEFGLVQLLVYNERTGNLVGGHQTLKILKEKGKEKAKMSVVDLPLSKEKQLNIALNKIKGEWERDRLVELLDELQEDEDDLMATGFDDKEIDNLIQEMKTDRDLKFLDEELSGAIDEEDFRVLSDIPEKEKEKTAKERRLQQERGMAEEKIGNENHAEGLVELTFALKRDTRQEILEILNKVKERENMKLVEALVFIIKNH